MKNNHSFIIIVMNDWSEARVDLLAATRRRSNRQISSSGIEGNVDKAES